MGRTRRGSDGTNRTGWTGIRIVTAATAGVGGHADAGTRGIERVEVSTDGGTSWTDATLSESLASTDVWRQWEHTYEASGRHEVVVRAIDGEGNLQPEDRKQAFPSGATGWVRRTVEP